MQFDYILFNLIGISIPPFIKPLFWSLILQFLSFFSLSHFWWFVILINENFINDMEKE